MTKDYKKDFLNHIDEKKKAELDQEKLNKKQSKEEKQKQLELYYKVVSNEFVKEVKDVVKTVNSKLKYFKARFEDSGIIYNEASFQIASLKFPDNYSLGGFVSLIPSSTNHIYLQSKHHVFQKLNDLGDYEDSDDVSLPQKRGKKTLDEDDIKEAREQFIRGAYELAKGFN
tara:strand:- start:293 stop:805 length:513 start_codon:yes stop_codon:yes gene_type:complete